MCFDVAASHALDLPGLGRLAMLGSVFFLDLSLRSLPIGTAYAVWTGIGAAGTAIIGMLWLGEPRAIGRMVCIFLIIAGVIGLKLNL